MVNHEYQMVDKSSGGDDNPLQRPQWWKRTAPIRRRETRVSETKGWSEILMNYYFFTTVSGAGTVMSVKPFFSAWMQTLWKMNWLLDSSGTWRTQTRLTWPGLTEFKCLCCCLWFAFPEYNILFRWMSYFDLGTQSWVSAPPRTLVSFSQSGSPTHLLLEEG